MTTFRSHRDNQRVLVEMWVVEAVDGDHAAAILLSQLLWWFQPAKGTREPRVRYEREGRRWLIRSDDDWYDDCRLTQKQVRRIRSALLAADLIVHRRFKVGGAPTGAWSPNFEALEAFVAAYESNAQMGSSPPSEAPKRAESGAQMGECISPNGTLPISTELSHTDNKPEATPEASPTGDKAKRATSFPAEFFITPEMRSWATEKAPSVDLRAETEQFCDYHRAKGDTMKDWTAAWRTWIRNAVKFGRTRAGGDGKVVTTTNGHRVSRSFANVDSFFANKNRNQGEIGQ